MSFGGVSPHHTIQKCSRVYIIYVPKSPSLPRQAVSPNSMVSMFHRKKAASCLGFLRIKVKVPSPSRVQTRVRILCMSQAHRGI